MIVLVDWPAGQRDNKCACNFLNSLLLNDVCFFYPRGYAPF